MRRLDAALANWCNGERSLEELTQLVQQHDATATLEFVSRQVQRLAAVGILEGSADQAGAGAARPSAPRPSSPSGPVPQPSAPPRASRPTIPPVIPPGERVSASVPRLQTDSPPVLTPGVAAPSAPRRPLRPVTANVVETKRQPAAAPPAPAPVRTRTPAPPPLEEEPVTPPPDPDDAPVPTQIASLPSVGEILGATSRPPVAEAETTAPQAAPLTPPAIAPLPPPVAAGGPRYAQGDEVEENTDALAAPLAGDAPVNPVDRLEKQLEAISSLAMDKGKDPTPQQAAGRGGGAALPWAILGLVLVGGGGYIGWTKYQGGGGTTEVPKTAVRVETVRGVSRGGQTLMAAGYLQAPKVISMGTTLGGRIKKLNVESGSKVKKNQVLIQFDDSQARAELGLAAAKLATAQRALKRQRQLFAAEAATASDVDNAVGAVEIAAAEWRVKQEHVEQCQIRAPINGTVIEVPVHEGEVIKGDSTAGVLIKLADLSEIRAEADVNEADVPLIRVGGSAEITAEGAAGQKFEGRVKEISQQVDKARGTVMVKVPLLNPPDTLRPGMSVKVAFREEEDAPKRFVLPRAAVVEGKVFVVEGGKAVPRPITYASAGPSSVEVTEGVKEGDRVVVEGAGTVREGQKLE